MLPFALLATAALAAEMDMTAPGFWSKAYSIPRTYCERRIAVSAPRPARLIAAATPCRFTEKPGAAFSWCQPTKEESDDVVNRLLHAGTLLSYSQDCNDPPELPELRYKRDNLRREWSSAPPAVSSSPAIAGLLSAQFATLDQIIAQDEAARKTVLLIWIRAPDDAGPLVWPGGPVEGAMGGVKRAEKVAHKIGTPYPPLPLPVAWRRTVLPPCAQVERLFVTFARASAEADARVFKTLQALGSPFDAGACPPAMGAGQAASFFSERPGEELKKRLVGLGSVRELRVEEATPPTVFVADDVRFDALSRALDERRAELADLPHIRSLMTAEIERVRAAAAQVRRLRKGRLVFVRFAD